MYCLIFLSLLPTSHSIVGAHQTWENEQGSGAVELTCPSFLCLWLYILICACTIFQLEGPTWNNLMLVQNQEASKGQIQPFLFHFLNEKLDKLFDKGLFFGGGGICIVQVSFLTKLCSIQPASQCRNNIGGFGSRLNYIYPKVLVGFEHLALEKSNFILLNS